MSRILLALIIILNLTMSVSAERKYNLFDGKKATPITLTDIVKKSLEFDLVFFGEFHDDSIIHKLQEEYLTACYKETKNIAVSMEMFERDGQKYLDEYLAGKIDEKAFLKDSRPWPEYEEFYKVLVELAKSNHAPVIAANIPRKYAGIYSNDGMNGIDKLPAVERAFVTRTMTIKEDDYMKNFFKVMIDNLGLDSNKKLNINQENTLYLYYGAQVIKDETMAESIVDFMTKNPKYKVIHFNGDFHSNGYLGTVQKVWDRNKNLKIAIITPDYVDEKAEPTFNKELLGKSDFVIMLQNKYTPPTPKSMLGGHLGENYLISHKIDLKLDPDSKSLSASDEFTFKSPVLKKCSISLLKDLVVTEVTSPDSKIKYEIKPDEENKLYNQIIIETTNKEINKVKMSYHGEVYHSPSVTLLNVKHSNTPGIISSKEGEGIYLPGGSYFPQANKDLADFDIKVSVPKDIKLITSGTITPPTIEGNNSIYNFKSELPTDEFIIVGGKFNIKDTVYDGKKFYLYTFGPTQTAETYLKSSIDYYKLYTNLFGAYPYSSFSIVENFFATGFGMPAYTLLSNKLMSMPWVLLAPGSLAHEFVHNWWGNSVYVDHELGNWCEALTTFSANYYYNVLNKNEAGAIDWRKKALLSLESLPEKSNYPVNKFKYQSNTDDATIGYQKGGFIFYEVMKFLGEKRFFDAIKNFATKYKGKRAYWMNLTSSFDEIAKKDSLKISMKKVMNQWLSETKVPTLKLENVSVKGDSLLFEINQDLENIISVPVRFTSESGKEIKYFTIKAKNNKFQIKPESKISSLVVDPNYEVLRKLNKWEIPYSFGRILTDNPLIVLPSKGSSDYDNAVKFAELVIESEYKVDYKSIDDLKDEDWANRSMIVVGNSKINSAFGKFKLEDVTDDNNLMLKTSGHPKSSDKYLTTIALNKIDSIEPFRRLFHYQSYSMVVINKNKPGRPINQKEIFPDATDKSVLEYIFK